MEEDGPKVEVISEQVGTVENPEKQEVDPPKQQQTLPCTITDFKKLEIAESSIERAGSGVFAKCSISDGEILCEYRGAIVPFNVVLSLEQESKRITLNDQETILGDNIASCINDTVDFREYSLAELRECVAKGTFLTHDKKHNAKLTKIHDKIFVTAIRNIQSGEEIFADFGHEFWVKQFKLRNWL